MLRFVAVRAIADAPEYTRSGVSGLIPEDWPRRGFWVKAALEDADVSVVSSWEQTPRPGRRSAKRLRLTLVFLVVVLAAAVGAEPVFASAIIGRNESRPTLTIDRQGRAHISYYAAGRRSTLVAWGAINARTPSRQVDQVNFQIRYGEAGRGICLPYDGPPLAWLVKACDAPDGSYWALQS